MTKDANKTGGYLLASLMMISLSVMTAFISSAVAAEGQPVAIMKDFDGEFHGLKEYTGQGKWTVVMLWASDCHVCNQEAANYQAFHDRITTINPEVRERFAENEDEIRANFERLGHETDDGWTFDQPMRVHLFRRT